MLDFPSTRGEVIGARVTEALVRSPLPSLFRLTENLVAGGRMLSLEEVKERSEAVGLTFNTPMREELLELFVDRKLREVRRQRIVATGPQDLGTKALGLFAELATTIVDPINVVSAFIPIVGPARYASWIARLGKPLARLGRGVTEGLVGAAVVEPIVLVASTEEQADYGFMDSLLNVTFGGVLGGGLHVGFGKLADVRKGRTQIRARRLNEIIDKLDPEVRQQAFRAAVVNVHEGVIPNPDLHLREDAAMKGGVEPRIDSTVPGEEQLRIKEENASAVVENVPEKLQAEIDRIKDPENSLLGGAEGSAKEDARLPELEARRGDSTAAEETLATAEEDLKDSVRAFLEEADDARLELMGLTRNVDEIVDVKDSNRFIAEVKEQEGAIRALVACMKRG